MSLKNFLYYDSQYEKITNNIKSIVSNNNFDDEVADTILNLYDYIMEKKLIGACHAISAVLYVALKEMGYCPEIKVGECKYKFDKPFDHSWIELNNKVVDLAIFMPLSGIVGQYGGPIIFDKDSFNMSDSLIQYGINTGLPFSNETVFAINTPISRYMSVCPFEDNGLWTVLERVYVYENELDIKKLMEKYEKTMRVIVR